MQPEYTRYVHWAFQLNELNVLSMLNLHAGGMYASSQSIYQLGTRTQANSYILIPNEDSK